MVNVQETLIKPGIEGTENVISTALKTQSVEVLLASMMSVENVRCLSLFCRRWW
jgi:hypothetical protein